MSCFLHRIPVTFTDYLIPIIMDFLIVEIMAKKDFILIQIMIAKNVCFLIQSKCFEVFALNLEA